jgi:putative hydrolase of the HAD superfamily
MAEREISERFRAALRAQEWSGRTSEELERDRWKSVAADVFSEFDGDFDAVFNDLWVHFGDSQNWKVYDDAIQTWHQIEAAGLRIGIASNFDQRLLDVARELEPLNRACHIFCSSEVGYSKPSPEFFRAVQDQLGLAPDEIMLVGDNWEDDVEGARAAGWRAVHLDRNVGPDEGAVGSLLDVIPLIG